MLLSVGEPVCPVLCAEEDRYWFNCRYSWSTEDDYVRQGCTHPTLYLKTSSMILDLAMEKIIAYPYSRFYCSSQAYYPRCPSVVVVSYLNSFIAVTVIKISRAQLYSICTTPVSIFYHIDQKWKNIFDMCKTTDGAASSQHYRASTLELYQ